MIAIPLNEKNSTVISDLYGNAPYFALLDIDSGTFKVIKNKGKGDGEETAYCVIDSGATSTIYYHMGEGLFKILDDNAINVYSASKYYLTLEEIYINFNKKEYKQLNKENAKTLLDAGNCTCKKK